MTAVTKFMFDVQFDPAIDPAADPTAKSLTVDDDSAATAGDDATGDGENEDEEEEEELPGYSEAQLEEAKAESFEAGRLEGARDAASTIEKETLLTVQAISLHITELFGRQEQANSVLLRDGIGIAATIARKLFPAMNEQNSLGEIDRMVEHTLLRLIEEPRVVIRVNPDLMETLDARVGDLKAGAGYEGRIVLKEDSALPFGDCRMEWGDGSAERNITSLWQSIDQILEGNLDAGLPQEVDQGAVEVSTLKTPEPETPNPEPRVPDDNKSGDEPSNGPGNGSGGEINESDPAGGGNDEETRQESEPTEPVNSETEIPGDQLDITPQSDEEAVVETSDVDAPESESPDNRENDENIQIDDENGEENRKESAPSEPGDGENMMPGEDSGIVGSTSEGDKPVDIVGEQADGPVDDLNSPPNEPKAD